MYIPKANEETRIPVIHELIRAQPLGALVTLGSGGLVATHLPLVLEDDGSEYGVLKGHVSRANPQWRDLVAAAEALAIFAGHHHYISAAWYPGRTEHGKEVPTWNYAVVHAYGTLRIVENEEWLLAHLTSLTDIHEAAVHALDGERPWQVSDAPAEYIAQMMNGIVGLELPIRRLEGRWKASQNRNERDRAAVAAGLERLGTPESLAMQAMVERK
ncbi:FMN-binding negative transcriptional regulator [Granulicella sp. WH15]|uniref:FMN-binding negative transcriptional regulator n=1 Tax=Granulicella sp. WH15 TaxID=2602070 RepID=UPI001366F0CA|nr:FMN-binding negative transcriptional regulator [Granulicella sp. WH15]QHN04960.1 FMN-binding negative transcriptional regulator [Granulicella sp. WH15]